MLTKNQISWLSLIKRSIVPTSLLDNNPKNIAMQRKVIDQSLWIYVSPILFPLLKKEIPEELIDFNEKFSSIRLRDECKTLMKWIKL